MKRHCLTTLLICGLSANSFSQTKQPGSYLFNTGWQFTAIEFRHPGNAGDTVRKLGVNWADQFNIQVENGADTGRSGDEHDFTAQQNLLGKLKWQPVTLPHIAFPEPVPVQTEREGLAYYKKHFILDKSLKGKKVVIEFEGAMQSATLWLNGKFLLCHTGGYLPFSADITGVAKYGAENEILVKLDNRPSPQVPPGKPVQNLDFLYYSGIYRSVRLHVSNLLHITDPNTAGRQAGGGIFVTYKNVSHQQAIVQVKTHIINENQSPKRFTVAQELADRAGAPSAYLDKKTVSLAPGADTELIQTITVPSPRLWSPDTPNLYTLHSVIREDQNEMDSRRTRIGIRSITITRVTGVLINGKPIRLVGSNRHMSYPWIGNALSDNANTRDAVLIKQSGMNCIRLCHYPQSPSFYDACDSLGILLLDCIPGWQYFNKSEAFKSHVLDDIRQTIRRDRNHPSILLWEMSLNETYPPAEFRCLSNEVAKSEWPEKENFYTSGDTYFTKGCWDVPYDDWNGDPGARSNTTYPDRPYLVREYGDYEFGGGESTSRKARGDGEKAMLQQAWNIQWEHNRNRKSYPACIGDLTWAFYDGLAGVTNQVETWGVADLYRIPKFSYYFFKSQQENARPMVYIAGYWTPRPSPADVVVYSNCEVVKLFVNDHQVAEQHPDNGQDAPYGTDLEKGGHPFTGGDASHLSFPPFTFKDVPYADGELKAVGYKNGKAVTTTSIFTPGKPARLILSAETNGVALAADGADAIFIRAKVLDAAGHPVPDSNNMVHFSIMGDASIVSPKDVPAEAGIATILIQSGLRHGNIQITATADGLTQSRLTIPL